MSIALLTKTMDIIQRYGNIAISILLIILAFKFSGLSKEVLSLKQEDTVISAKVAENEIQKQVVNEVLGKMKDIGELNGQIVVQLKEVIQYNTNMVTEVAKMQEDQKIVKEEVAALGEIKNIILADHEITLKNEKDIKYVMDVINKAVDRQNADLKKSASATTSKNKATKTTKDSSSTKAPTKAKSTAKIPPEDTKTTWKFIKPWTWF